MYYYKFVICLLFRIYSYAVDRHIYIGYFYDPGIVLGTDVIRQISHIFIVKKVKVYLENNMVNKPLQFSEIHANKYI